MLIAIIILTYAGSIWEPDSNTFYELHRDDMEMVDKLFSTVNDGKVFP